MHRLCAVKTETQKLSLLYKGPRKPRQEGQTSSMFSAKLTKPNHQHVTLHPRFSGQHDELDEQSDQSTGWMPKIVAHQASPGKLRQAQLARKHPQQVIKFSIFMFNWLTVMHSLNMFDPNKTLILFRKKSYKHTCIYSAVKLKSGNPKWSAKRKQMLCKESAENSSSNH